MSKIRLSHSAATRYIECGKSYQYHYIKRYRSPVMSAALLFGTAIDRAGDEYLTSRNPAKAKHVFRQTWREQELNNVLTELQACPEIVYGNSDFDIELIDASMEKAVEPIFEGSPYKDLASLMNFLQDRKDKVGFDRMSLDEKKRFNYANWLCMLRKGHLMLDAFIEYVDNNVIECLGSQVKIELEDENGNTVIGYADFVFRVKNEEHPIVYDLKTAARAYEHDSVRKSPQLSGYVYALRDKFPGMTKAAYLVLSKQIRKNRTKICKKCGNDGSGKTHKTCDNTVEAKRCHGDWDVKLNLEATMQIIIDTVPELMVQHIAENFNSVLKGIEAEIFPRNFGNCIKYNGAVICAFFDICHKNSMKGIIIKPEEDK